MNIKLKKISEIANVSIATVSLALNNKPGISEETRAKVLRIAKTLHEEKQENSILNQDSSGTLQFVQIIKHGCSINSEYKDFIRDYQIGVNEAAKRLGYNIKVNQISSDNINRIIGKIEEVASDGYLILGTELSIEDVRALNKMDKPVVFMDTHFHYEQACFVNMNNLEEVHFLVEHLVNNGHKKIAYIKTDQWTRNHQLREEGFTKAMDYFELPFKKKHILTVNNGFEEAYKDMKLHLGKFSKIPRAIVAVNDTVAYACMKAITDTGYQIPFDFSIVGFDNLESPKEAVSNLTTIAVKKHRIAEKAVQLMVEKIYSQDSLPSTKITIGGKLIPRDSVKNILEG